MPNRLTPRPFFVNSCEVLSFDLYPVTFYTFRCAFCHIEVTFNDAFPVPLSCPWCSSIFVVDPEDLKV